MEKEAIVRRLTKKYLKPFKKVRKEVIVTSIILALILLLIIIILKPFFTYKGEVLFSPTIPTNCSDSNITTLWDSIIDESSSGITIISNTSDPTKCNAFYATKNIGNTLYILTGKDFNNEVKILALKANVTTDYNIAMTSVDSILSNEDKTIGILNNFDPDGNFTRRTSGIINITQARTEFESSFNEESISDLTESTFAGNRSYVFVNQTLTTTTDKETTGTIMINHTATWMLFTNITITSCTPNWTAQNTTCTSGETQTIYYTDSNNCGVNTSRPENQTSLCDSNGNKIYGNFSLNTKRISLSTYINGTLGNTSTDYSTYGTKKVELKSGSQTIIEFNWSFTNPLDTISPYIEKQSSNASKGYLLIKGISATKTIYVDKKTTSSSICIKNREINSINEISSGCNSSYEVKLTCPGSGSGYSCSLTNNNYYFKVTGLTRSGAIEFTSPGTTANCITNWTCSGWSPCINSQQSRTCLDSNGCNTSSGKPLENQSCGNSCTATWSCTNYPDECPSSGNKTRTCTKTNACTDESNKPPESKSCESSDDGLSPIFVWIIIGIIFILIIIIIFAFILMQGNKNNKFAPGDPFIKDTGPKPPSLPFQTPAQPQMKRNYQQPQIPQNPGNIPVRNQFQPRN